jgi:glutamine synthetase
VLFDGSAIEGFIRIEETDMFLKPDLETFRIFPWPSHQAGGNVGRLICDIEKPDGTPFEGCPRTVLKRVVARAAEMGLALQAGPEVEFFLFHLKEGAPTTQTHDAASYFDLTPVDRGEDVRREIVLALEAMGFLVEAAHHEVSAGQHEIDLRHEDVLVAADHISTFRLVVKHVALRNGLHATFMPKPIYGINGSGLHIHQVLLRNGRNAFDDGGSEWEVSDTCRHFIGGQLRHARGFCAITNPLVNSYKRLVPGYEAPVYVCWARRNRSALVRVPMYKPGKEQATRIEYRSPDPACNPYLGFAAMLAAGLAGIEGEYDLPPEASNNIYEMSEAERRAAGIRSLPEDLFEAIELAADSKLLRDVLGDHVHEFLIRNKREEWDAYKAYVTPYELERYLPLL